MNRFCHTLGIPLIALSVLLGVIAIFVSGLWAVALTLFVLGWVFQFVGHYVYEKKSPAFARNLVHLLVGPLWILARVIGRA